jgi:hypothetical protein
VIVQPRLKASSLPCPSITSCITSSQELAHGSFCSASGAQPSVPKLRSATRHLPLPLPAEFPTDTMPYKGCTLEYWPKCMTQQVAFSYCNARGGDLFSYIDDTDRQTFFTFTSRQNDTIRFQSVQCIGQAVLWPTLSACVWTGLRSQSGSRTCGRSCVWQDMGTQEVVTNLNSITPCSLVGDGNALHFVIWNQPDLPEGGCPQGGSNDIDDTFENHFICRVKCGE